MSFQPGLPRSAWVTTDPSGSMRSSRPCGDETITRRPFGSQAVHSGTDSTRAITSLRPPRSTASTSPADQSEKYSRPPCQRGDSTSPRPVSSAFMVTSPPCPGSLVPSVLDATALPDSSRLPTLVSMPTEEAAPLAGLRIVEISSFVAAPLGGMTLAQLGAEVIRIDPVGGAADVTRWPLAPSGTSLYWTGLNKGKRSVTLDFRSDQGRDTLRNLVAGSGPDGGIVLTNADSPWLSYEALSKRRPDLVHLKITGRHDGGPAVDYTVNAAVGFPLATG